MDQLQQIKLPIEKELGVFLNMFDAALRSSNPLLNDVLKYIKQQKGKMMRPMLTFLMGKVFGGITDATYHGALSLELLHSASLIHDDVVDESSERRGQRSVNAVYDNKISVLVGDFILSASLRHSALSQSPKIVDVIAKLGQFLAEGEIMQLSNTLSSEFSEEIYFDVIRKKTAVLFSSCAAVGAIAGAASDEQVQKAYDFGELIGIAFQIKDDIFDYSSSEKIGKPTGNDMKEGKLTLPALYVLKNGHGESFRDLALKIRSLQATNEEIAHFIEEVKSAGGIDYAEKMMESYRDKALSMLPNRMPDDVHQALNAYINFVINRKK